VRAGASLLLEISHRSDWRKVLACLGEADDKGEVLTTAELSARTGLSTDVVRGCLAYLESRGLVG
jgi:DNA-binding IscR family transcriptional regulator